MASRIGPDNRQYRHVLQNFGKGSTIQGTEDWPIDPTIEDAKFIGLGVLIGSTVLAVTPQEMIALGWIAAAVILALTGVIMYIAPSERAPLEWLTAMVRFKRRAKRLTNHAENPKEQTQSLTKIERVLPIASAIERTDGAIVGLVEVKGRDMALAEEDAWATAAEGFEQLARALDSTVEIFSPARTIHPSRLSKGYLGREHDEDVRRNPTLRKLVNVYLDELPNEFNRRATAIRRFYVVVSVTEREVRRDDQGALADLAELPGIGGPIERFGLAKRGPEDAEIKERQRSILSARKRAVENAVSSIEGCEATEVDDEYLTAIIKEFWTGKRVR